MGRILVVVLIGLIVSLAGVSFSPAQDSRGGTGDRVAPVDGSSNGQPSPTRVDSKAVAELERAHSLYSEEDDSERTVISICLPLVAAFEASEDYGHLVDCVFLLGDAYYHLGEWSNAERYMQQAADLGFRYFADEMSTYPLKVIGECQFEQDMYEDALDTFRERVQYLRKEGDSTDLAGALFDVGGMLINLEREEEALTVLTEALQANNARAGELSKAGSGASEDERTGNVVDHAEITYHLAIANFRLEKYEQARTFLEQANAFFDSVNEAGLYDVTDRLVAVLDDLVLVNERLGDSIAAGRYQRERDQLNQ